MKTEFSWSDIMEVEDSLQAAHIFYNGIRGKGNPCHSDSYMTMVDFESLEKWWDEQTFEPAQLAYCVNYWKENVNMQPLLRIVAYIVGEKLNAKA